MQRLQSIIYRYLTNADFYNMYKPRDSESGGGGQTYIDFPVQDISIEQWTRFLRGVDGVGREQRTHGPSWSVPILSIGVEDTITQEVLIYQRRAQSVSIANQTLGRESSNRIQAWLPRNGFPQPRNSEDRQQCPPGLAVFLARSADQVWAGWFQNDGRVRSPASAGARSVLGPLFEVPTSSRGRAGVIERISSAASLDESNRTTPFRSLHGPSGLGSRALAASETQQEGKKRRVRATDSQGYELNPERRKAVELYAMARATEAYPGAEDTSRTKSFDLRTHEGTTEVRVEVKGTLGTGERVILTTKEVQNARGDKWRTDLFIVSEIRLEEQHGQFIASGGRTRVIQGWAPLDEDLTPTQYRYKVPR